eukprot:11414117-Alexandrium_andersonii.AAC.1
MLQQVVIFSKWWALAEASEQIGLGSRFLFSFGAPRCPGDYSLVNFGRLVALPFLRQLFTVALRAFGPARPFSPETPEATWGVTEEQQRHLNAVKHIAFTVAANVTFGMILRSAVNKALYWITSVALQGTLL